MEMDLQIEVRREEDVAVIILRGEVDAYTCARLREAMIEAIEDGGANLVVDMKNVDYIDSSGLGTLVGGLKRVSERQGAIAVVCTNPQIRKVFDITGLVKVFPIYSSEDDAVKALNTRGKTVVS